MGRRQAEIESEQRKEEDEREGKTCKVGQIRAKEAVFGSVRFGASRIRIRILPSSSNNTKKNLYFSNVLRLLSDVLL
jgi:hypothetical protein